MVKNNGGGNKSKKMGRKFSVPQSEKNVRLSESSEEIYASVTKLLGNGMFHAVDTENKERLCIMRQKFKGRGKRDNTVSVGSWVLIGIRSWEGGSCSKPKCDLLEVYNDIEKAKLKKTGDAIFSKLRNDAENYAGGSKAAALDGFEFNDDDEEAAEEYKNIIKDIISNKRTHRGESSEYTSREDADSPSIEKVKATAEGQKEEEEDYKLNANVSGTSISTKTKIKKTKNNNTVFSVVPSSIGSGDKSFAIQEINIDDI